MCQKFGHVLDFVPDNRAHKNRGLLLGGHRHAIARTRIELDDLLLMELVLGTDDKAAEVGAIFQVIDHCPFHMRAERGQDVGEKIVGERAFLSFSAQKHGDGIPHPLIHVDDKNFGLIAKKNRASGIGGNERADLNGYYCFVHEADCSTGSIPGKRSP